MSAMNTRHWCLRKLESTHTNLEWVCKHLFEVHETYKQYHPEISDTIANILDMTVLIDDILTKLKEKI